MRFLMVLMVALGLAGALGCIALGLLTDVDGRHAALGFLGCAIVIEECYSAWARIAAADRNRR